MRKTTLAMALGLALSVGSTVTAVAQGTPQRREQTGEQRDPGRRGMRGGPDMMLLKGITLTDAQKTQLQALRTSDRESMKGSRDQFEKVMTEARAARQRGDTAQARKIMEPLRVQMEQEREQRVASIRNLLTADQRTQFDANVAEWKQRAAEHRKTGDARRPGAQHGHRDGGR